MQRTMPADDSYPAAVPSPARSCTVLSAREAHREPGTSVRLRPRRNKRIAGLAGALGVEVLHTKPMLDIVDNYRLAVHDFRLNIAVRDNTKAE